MKYNVTLTYFTKSKDGMLVPHTESISGSKTVVFTHISEILKGDFESITVIINK